MRSRFRLTPLTGLLLGIAAAMGLLLGIYAGQGAAPGDIAMQALTFCCTVGSLGILIYEDQRKRKAGNGGCDAASRN
ncbi:MAG: hypothetical protein NW241_00255 [Bacteroidia bacterium]|nr:hypothetical protein [Bacteroidia bacterium]